MYSRGGALVQVPFPDTCPEIDKEDGIEPDAFNDDLRHISNLYRRVRPPYSAFLSFLFKVKPLVATPAAR